MTVPQRPQGLDVGDALFNRTRRDIPILDVIGRGQFYGVKCARFAVARYLPARHDDAGLVDFDFEFGKGNSVDLVATCRDMSRRFFHKDRITDWQHARLVIPILRWRQGSMTA